MDDFSLCLVLNTRMAARAVTRRADRALRPFGITASQFTVLGALRSQPGRSVTEMAEAIAMDRSTLSRNLDLLESKGLVANGQAESGNGRISTLTRAGDQVIEAVLPAWRKGQAEWNQLLDRPDFNTVLAALRQLARISPE